LWSSSVYRWWYSSRWRFVDWISLSPTTNKHEEGRQRKAAAALGGGGPRARSVPWKRHSMERHETAYQLFGSLASICANS